MCYNGAGQERTIYLRFGMTISIPEYCTLECILHNVYFKCLYS